MELLERLIPPSLSDPKNLKDAHGQPWVPTKKESLIYGLIWALIIAIILELARMLNYVFVGARLNAFAFEWTHLIVFMIYVLACLLIIVLPVLYWRKKRWMKRRGTRLSDK